MNAPQQQQVQPEEWVESEESGVLLQKRRQILTGGAAAVLTLASRSALAAVGTGKSPSGFTSGNTSQGHSYTCSGNPRAYYCTGGAGANSWPATTSCTKTDYFHGKFPSGTYCNLGSTRTHSQVINNSSSCDPTGIGGYYVAAMLNINNNLVDVRVLTLTQLVSMFQQFSTYGYYQPMGNGTVQWNASQIITYLQQNNIVPS